MEPESPSPYPQVPATCPYPEPTPSSPHDSLQLPEDPNTGIRYCNLPEAMRGPYRLLALQKQKKKRKAEKKVGSMGVVGDNFTWGG